MTRTQRATLAAYLLALTLYAGYKAQADEKLAALFMVLALFVGVVFVVVRE